MTGVTLAFYKGIARHRRHRMEDWLVRFKSRGPYSHVEVVFGSIDYGRHLCYTSSGRDGGVRKKEIDLHPNHWNLVFVPCDVDHARAVFKKWMGQPYDYTGILLSQVLNLSRHSSQRWFCSEIAGEAIGIKNSHKADPAFLWNIAQGWSKSHN